jgi:peptidoglycan biosynthesis protein MviN/MurJ (putative lipid II flippase)
VTVPVAERGGARHGNRGIGGAAVMIGVITVLARLVGFGRQVVFAHTVGTTCLGTAYTTANMVPNIIYDIVLGGALSAVVVPVLAGPAGRAAEQARQISSALLTWTVALLVPVSVAVAFAAHAIVGALLSGASGCPRGQMISVGTRMLIVFAPQVLLYGLAVVLYGILQSHRRFGAPALAPLLSSLVVVVAYAVFGMVAGAYVNRLHALPRGAEYLLSGGTTLGVLALVLTAVVPAWRLRIGLRPTWRFPAGVGPRVRRLAIAGLLTLVAQDASVAVVIVLANRYGDPGALVLYLFAWAVFVVPFAVLAIPIATSAFPELSARSVPPGGTTPPGTPPHGGASRPPIPPSPAPAVAAPDALPDVPPAPAEAPQDLPPYTADAPHGLPPYPTDALGDLSPYPAGALGGLPPGQSPDGGFDATAAASTRAVLVASWLGAAALVGARVPLARVFESHHTAAASVLALALAAFAPGLIGYGLSANLSRVLYAQGRNRAPALAISAGWLLVVVADLLIVPAVPRARVVPALGLATSIGLTFAGVALLALVARFRGAASLAGVLRAFLAGLTGCAAAAAVGSAVAALLKVSGFFPNVGMSILISAVVTGVFAVVVLNVDGGDLRAALRGLRSRVSAAGQ